MGTGKRKSASAYHANAFEDNRQRCFAAGMDDFLAKPVNMNLLVVTLNKWAANRLTGSNR